MPKHLRFLLILAMASFTAYLSGLMFQWLELLNPPDAKFTEYISASGQAYEIFCRTPDGYKLTVFGFLGVVFTIFCLSLVLGARLIKRLRNSAQGEPQ